MVVVDHPLAYSAFFAVAFEVFVASFLVDRLDRALLMDSNLEVEH